MKVYRNIKLKGVISKNRALALLGGERELITTIKNQYIIISRNDFEDINIDLYNMVLRESVGGAFEELKQ